jgi:hypothetical protein
MADNWYSGNANIDSKNAVADSSATSSRTTTTSVPQTTSRSTGIHPAGEQRAGWVTDEYRITFLVLVRGRFRLNLPAESFVLEHEGDYVMRGA